MRFLIDANGILNVTARDLRTGKEQSIDVKPSYGLTDEQVEAMILESFDKAEEDFKERQVREARVEADAILGAAEKARKTTLTTRLPDEDRAAIDRAINELLLVYHSDDHLLIRDQIEQLNQATMALAETMMNTAVGKALEGNQNLMPKLTWQNLDDIALALYEKFPGHRPDARPLHRPAQMDHRAGRLRRRSAKIERSQARSDPDGMARRISRQPVATARGGPECSRAVSRSAGAAPHARAAGRDGSHLGGFAARESFVPGLRSARRAGDPFARFGSGGGVHCRSISGARGSKPAGDDGYFQTATVTLREPNREGFAMIVYRRRPYDDGRSLKKPTFCRQVPYV